MPQIKKFLCCCELRTGALIIGWMGLTLSLISLGGLSAILAEFNMFDPAASGRLSSYEKEVDSENKEWARGFLVCTAILSLTNILLIWGAIAKNRFLLFPWLIVTMLTIISLILTVVLFGAIMANSGGDKGVVAGIFISGFLVAGIILYLWICIKSFFRELREESLEKEEQDIALIHNLEVN